MNLAEAKHPDVALVIEDDRLTAEAIAGVVAALGFEVNIACTLGEARDMARRIVPSLVLADLGMPDGDGAEIVRELKAAGVLDLIIISGTAEQARVVESLRIGVSDFLIKPVKLSTIHKTVTDIVDARQRQSVGVATPAGHPNIEPARLVGSSPALRELRLKVERAAAMKPLRAVVTGAPGVGKRNIAASIHHESGAAGRALCVNCAQEVDDSTLVRFFGREPQTIDDAGRPAHTPIAGYLEMAETGTLVLDDISQLPLSFQSNLNSFVDTGQLSRVGALTSREVSCGIIGILREPLADALEAGRLSEDLYYSLAKAVINVPPLTERDEDILELAERAIAELNRLTGTDKALSEELRSRLRNYAWPGNVLELKNTLRIAYQGTEPDEEIELNRVCLPALAESQSEPAAHLVGNSFWEVEKKLLLATLEYTNGNKRQAARTLGISLKTLYNRLHAYQ